MLINFHVFNLKSAYQPARRLMEAADTTRTIDEIDKVYYEYSERTRPGKNIHAVSVFAGDLTQRSLPVSSPWNAFYSADNKLRVFIRVLPAKQKGMPSLDRSFPGFIRSISKKIPHAPAARFTIGDSICLYLWLMSCKNYASPRSTDNHLFGHS